MDLTALLLSKDQAAQSMIRRVLAKVGIRTVICSRPAAGLRLMKSSKYEGIVVDCDDLDCGIDLLAMLRDVDISRNAIVFALINGGTTMSEAFGLGANFVLEKPLVYERVFRCFRAAQGLMIGERRRYYRHPVDFIVNLDFPKHLNGAIATMADLSMGGMLIQGGLDLTEELQGFFKFALPDVKEEISGACQVVWRSEDRVGLRFTQLSTKSRNALEIWLNSRFAEAFPNIIPLIEDTAEYVTVQ